MLESCSKLKRLGF